MDEENISHFLNWNRHQQPQYVVAVIIATLGRFSFDFWCSFHALQGEVDFKLIHFLPPSASGRTHEQNDYEMCKKFISLLYVWKAQLLRGACWFGLLISSFVMITC